MSTEDLELSLDNLKLYAEENGLSYEKLKRTYLKQSKKKGTKKDKDDAKEGKTSRKKNKTRRKKKTVNMERNCLEDTARYSVTYEQQTINNIQCYIPVHNGQLIPNEYVYNDDSIRIGVVVKDSILFFSNH